MSEADEALTLLSCFLSFVRGASVAAVLPCGLGGSGEVLWEGWGSANRTVAPWRTDLTWFDRLSMTGELPALFWGFARRWFDEADQAVLRYSLGYYEEANDLRPLQAGLTWANSGLELMAWVYLVRDGPMSDGEFDRSGARRGTFKELLNSMSISTDRVSELLPALRKAGQVGPDAIWGHLGSFVHPRMGKVDINIDELVDSWRLAVHYLELVLLYWFGHEGHYASRLEAPRWVGSVEPVPWSRDAT